MMRLTVILMRFGCNSIESTIESITKTVHNFLQCLFSVDLNILRLQIEFKVCQSQQNRVVFFLKKNKQANREAKTTRYLYVCRSNAF